MVVLFYQSAGSSYINRSYFLIHSNMSLRTFLFTVFALSIGLLLHRDRCNHPKTVHVPAPAIQLSASPTVRPYYTTGPIRNVALPELTALESITRKKINSFVINHYNQYKFEFTFVDLGYASQFMVSFYAEDTALFKMTEKLGFSLSEGILDGSMNYDFYKQGLNFTVRQYIDQQRDETVTIFNISSHRWKSNFTANLTTIVKNQQCLTAIRSSDVVSHKCFGGIAGGKIRLDRFLVENGENMKRNSVFNPTFNLTRVVFDGLRGSGMHWNWVWGVASGFSKPEFYALHHTMPKEKYFGINFGHLDGQGEDMIFLNGKEYPIQGINYTVDEAFKDVFYLSSESPRMEANFTVHYRTHELKDMGFAKLDMVKAEGMWAGWIEDEEGEKFQFYLIAGLIETCDSLF